MKARAKSRTKAKTKVKAKLKSHSKVKAKAKTRTKAKARVLPIPAGYNSVIPYMTIQNAARAIEYYKSVFGAKEVMRLSHDGVIAHAEIKIGDSKIMIGDESLAMGARGPEAFGGSPVTIHLYIKNVDEVVRRAVDAGARITQPVQDKFYGDRAGALTDPFGHKWYVSTHIEDVSKKEMARRMDEMMKKQAAG